MGVKKAKGKTKEVDKLKFKSEIKSIELNQYGNTHRYDFQNNTITFFKHKCKILGLGQIKDKVDFVNAFTVSTNVNSSTSVTAVCWISIPNIQ